MQRSHRLILISMCISLGAVVSAVSSLNVALPDLARATGASTTQLQWIVDAYALVFAGLLLPAGALGDRLGRRAVLLIGLVVFGGGAAGRDADRRRRHADRRPRRDGRRRRDDHADHALDHHRHVPAETRDRAVGVWAGVAGGSALWSACSPQACCWRSSAGPRSSASTPRSRWPARALTLRFVPAPPPNPRRSTASAPRSPHSA